MSIKLHGIKKAVGEYQRWTNSGTFRTACIMLDIDSGNVWCDCFTDTNSWKTYIDESVVDISKELFNARKKVTMINVKVIALDVIRNKRIFK